MRRHYLFLQGPGTDFFSRVAAALRLRGHATMGLSFCAGDAFLWRHGGRRLAYRGRLEQLDGFLDDLVARLGVTDLMMLGDTRPVHRVACAVARKAGLRVHVWEEGYFRPYWLTLERGGINGYSRLPRDPGWYREVAPRLKKAAAPQPLPNPIARLAAWELAYKLPGLFNPLLYPGYRTHRPWVSPVEFLGWGLRFARMHHYRRRDARTVAGLRQSRRRVFLFPLQLDGDGQITCHSPFGRMEAAIETVLGSFARHAPGDAVLLVKNHPLDTGWEGYGRRVVRMARQLDLSGRIHFLETGHLPELLELCAGVVTINSTVGTAALAAGKPIIALGRAIYDLPGLTHQDTLDAFWREPQPPDPTLFDAFRRVVIHTTQVPGSFYSRQGQEAAIAAAMRFLEPKRSPLEALL